MAQQSYNDDTNDGTATVDGDAPTGEETDEGILAKARREYRMCRDAEGGNRIDALDDLRFLAGGENQWDVRAVAARRADGRPVITVNDLPSFLHQVTNDQRQNRPSIKVHPVDDRADLATAKVMQGMIRHIEYDSNADIAYDRSVNSAAAVGFGYWRLTTEYESQSSFNQKICFKSVRNALSVRLDPVATEPDGSDIQFAFLESLLSKEDFKKEYPDAKAAGDMRGFEGDTSYSGWYSDNTVLVCDYYCIKKKAEEVVLLSNGESGFKSDLLQLPPGVTIQTARPSERRRVMLYKITATDILERTEIKCDWIPVFPVYGDEIDIEGKVVRSGIVRNAKGPAQAYNVMISGATEEIALRSKAPYIGGEGQFEGHEQEWAQANNRAFPFLEYKPTTVGEQIVPPPARQAMADIPTGMLAMAMHAQDNKKKTTGLFDASLGARGSATSGRQEIAQQREGDMANFHYMDGLLRTIRHCGRCLVCMIPYYYDTERVVRILGEDGEENFARINQPNLDKKPGKDGTIHSVLNDVTVGEYDITVSAGPSYSTMRQESAEFFTAAMQAAKDPATAAVVTYLAMKNQDVPGGEIATKMLEKLLPPPAQQVLQEEGGRDEPTEIIQTPRGPLPIAQVPQVLAQLEQGMEMAAQALQKSQADKNSAEVMKQQNEERSLEIKANEADTKAYEADTARQEMERQKAVDLARAEAEAEKYRAEQLHAMSEAHAESHDKPAEGSAVVERLVALDQALAAVLEQLAARNAAMPQGMKIKSPLSGQVYDVDFTHPH